MGCHSGEWREGKYGRISQIVLKSQCDLKYNLEKNLRSCWRIKARKCSHFVIQIYEENMGLRIDIRRWEESNSLTREVAVC